MYLRPRTRQHIATGLMILFLALALVPIYQILAKMSPSGRFVQLCSAMGIQTVWVADDPDGAGLPLLKAKATTSANIGSAAQNSPNLSSPSPFGSCEFCWTSVLATALPLALMLFLGLPTAQFVVPITQTQTFQSFLRRWHARPRAPPVTF